MNKIWVVIFSIFILYGCNTAQNKVDYYKPIISSNSATIVGSRTENGAFVADEILYILAVDGKPVENAEEIATNPFTIPPG